MKITSSKRNPAFFFSIATLATFLLLAQLPIFTLSSQSRSLGDSLPTISSPGISSLETDVPIGSSVQTGVVVNNSLSAVSWIVVGATFSFFSIGDITLTTKNLLPYVSSIPAMSVAIPFSIMVTVPKITALGNYSAECLLTIRTSLLPPYNTEMLPFNITIVVIPPIPPPATTQILFFDSVIVLLDCAAIFVIAQYFVRRIS